MVEGEIDPPPVDGLVWPGGGCLWAVYQGLGEFRMGDDSPVDDSRDVASRVALGFIVASKLTQRFSPECSRGRDVGLFAKGSYCRLWQGFVRLHPSTRKNPAVAERGFVALSQ